MNYLSKIIVAYCMLCIAPLGIKAQPAKVTWDSKSLLINGKRVIPVMGEVHYSRIPKNEWRNEIRKIKAGGVTLIATYVFWNHIEEQEGIFNWSGQRDLRQFLSICKDENIPVVLRLGPFCHGEVRNGGIPDWMFEKKCKLRSEQAEFLKYVQILYRQIFTQVQDLQWKDGGPLIACQFDNEYRGRGSYLIKLKQIAQHIGFDLPFYTRTGWPELSSPIPFGEIVPLYGDYADGFWDRNINEGTGNYYKAFNFKAFRSSTAIATEQITEQQETIATSDKQYPYFTCELGGGMATAYHRRPYIYPEDAYSMAVVKLGSGSNLLGYYMYHGGTNPDGQTTLNENQRTPGTNYNDLPIKNYDFQAPIGEFGQTNPHYYMLRPLHLFMKEWGEQLAEMDAHFPCKQDIAQGDDSFLRWNYRCKGNKAFVFINNYERLQKLKDKKNITFNIANIKFPSHPINIPSGTVAIFPVNIDGIRYATAQLVAKKDNKIILMKIDNVPVEIAVGKTILKNVKPQGINKPIYKNIYLIDKYTAEHLFLNDSKMQKTSTKVHYEKMKEGRKTRLITIGVQKVAEAPTDSDFEQAATYVIKDLPNDSARQHKILQINYRGDCARIYANGKMIADNFYNGRPFLLGLWRLPEECNSIEVRILPLQKNMPVYFPREAKVNETGEYIDNITIWQ